MERIEKMSPEVLIYLQTVKSFIKSTDLTRKYFNIENNEDAFFENLGEMSQKNFDEHGEPQLSLEQFEKLRKKYGTGKEIVSIGMFASLGEYGYVSLN
jgi:hypothetical protein